MTIADITYYVDATNGNDSNDGSQSHPFKTIQYAINLLPQIINNNITINLVAGTYNEDVVGKGFFGKGFLKIIGVSGVNVNSISFYNIHIDFQISTITFTTTTKTAVYLNKAIGAVLSSLTITSSATSQIGIQGDYSILYINNCTISNRQYAMNSSSSSTIFSNNNMGSNNNYGLLAQNASTIGKMGTQPTGTTNESIFAGGAIR